jgi:hypothetical protein
LTEKQTVTTCIHHPVTTIEEDHVYLEIAVRIVRSMDMDNDEVQWSAQRRKITQDLLAIQHGFDEGPHEIVKLVVTDRELTREEKRLVRDVERLWDERSRLDGILEASIDLQRRAKNSPLSTDASAELAPQLDPLIGVLKMAIHKIEVKLGIDKDEGAVQL